MTAERLIGHDPRGRGGSWRPSRASPPCSRSPVRANRSAAFDLAMTIRLQGWQHPVRGADATRHPGRASRRSRGSSRRRSCSAGGRPAGADAARSSSRPGAARRCRRGSRSSSNGRGRSHRRSGRGRAARRHELSSGHVLTYVAFYGFLGSCSRSISATARSERLRGDPHGRARPRRPEPDPAGPPLDDRRGGVVPASVSPTC